MPYLIFPTAYLLSFLRCDGTVALELARSAQDRMYVRRWSWRGT